MAAAGEYTSADRGITPEIAGTTISPHLPFENKIVVVTGASKLEPLGIGAATALEFARQGAAAVIVTGTDRPDTQGHDVKERIEATGGTRSLWLAGDIKEPVTVFELISQTTAAFGHIDIIVNNAGVIKDRRTIDMPVEDWDEVIDTNVRPAFLTIKELLQQQAYNKEGGAVVNMSSVVGIYGNEGQDNYSAAKAALAALTKTHAVSLARVGYRANAVAPGLIDTEMTHKKLVEREIVRKAAEALIPVGRIGEPQDIANAVVFLAGPQASYINGQVLEVDGGLGGKLGAIPVVTERDIRIESVKKSRDKDRARIEELQTQLDAQVGQ